MTDFKDYFAHASKHPNRFVVTALNYVKELSGPALDLGAGTGRDAKFLRDNGFSPVIAVEPSTAAPKKLGEGIIVVRQSAEQFLEEGDDGRPYLDHFPLAVCENVLFFVKQKTAKQILADTYKALRPGGVMVYNVLGEKDEWVGHREDVFPFKTHEVAELQKLYPLVNKIHGYYRRSEQGTLANGTPHLWDTHNLIQYKPRV